MRLMKKGIKMMKREKKIFLVFTFIYTILIFLTSLFIHTTFEGGTALGYYFIFIFFFTSLILSILYAWILVSRNRRVYATLKCIGYTNRNINSMITGIILYTTILGFILALELLFHYAAIVAYLHGANLLLAVPSILVGLLPLVITFGMFLVVQLVAILLANRRVLKVRPMLALKRVGE